jgi:hypothetical protein
MSPRQYQILLPSNQKIGTRPPMVSGKVDLLMIFFSRVNIFYLKILSIAPKIDNEKCKDAPGCGKWSPPMINNPKYKGKWKAPLINNPKYQGKWEPRKIANPDYFEDTNPFKSLTTFSGIGLELWSMTDNIYFDNFLITDDEAIALDFAKKSWEIKKKLELIGSRSSVSS